MTVTQRLLNATADIWAEYNKHPFLQGLEHGTLDREKFRYYIIQDYHYLLDYMRSFAVGLAKAQSYEMRKLFSSYVTMLTDSEMDIHEGYLGKLQVTQQELQETPVALDNLSYTSYMLRIAYEEGETEILTAILSCALSYEYIAKNIVKSTPTSVDDPFYGDWVKGYTSERYCKENIALTDMLEKAAEGYSEKQLEHLAEIFVICSRYELAFWEMAWTMRK